MEVGNLPHIALRVLMNRESLNIHISVCQVDN